MHLTASLDGLLSQLATLERLKEEALRRYGDGFGQTSWSQPAA